MFHSIVPRCKNLLFSSSWVRAGERVSSLDFAKFSLKRKEIFNEKILLHVLKITAKRED